MRRTRDAVAVALPYGGLALVVAREAGDDADSRMGAVLRGLRRGGRRRDGRGQQAIVGSGAAGVSGAAALVGGDGGSEGVVGAEERQRLPGAVAGASGAMVALPALGHGLAGHS